MDDFRKVTYTADDEDPECGRCDYFNDGFDCCGSCVSPNFFNAPPEFTTEPRVVE